MFDVREYDFCMSLGGSCAIAMQLKQRGLRIASMPLDWIRGRGNSRYLDTIGKMLENRFEGWCAFDNLVPMPDDLDRPKATDPLEVRAWDKVHDIGFYHDFRYDIVGKGGREYYEGIAARYRRRIDRLYDILSRATNVIAIVIGPDEPIPRDDVVRLKSRLDALRPGLTFTLVALGFNAAADYEQGSLAEGLLVREFKRDQHAYDYTKTTLAWDFLEDVKLSGRIVPEKESKRNATKGMSFWYRIHRKLYLHCKKVLERRNEGVRRS